jgi:ferrous iron transport protein B
VILGLTIVLWALLSLPHSAQIEHRFAVAAERVNASVGGDERRGQLDDLRREASAAQLRHSVAGRVAIAAEPALEPLGMDWRIGVAVFGSFAARELLVSTLGMVFAVTDADEGSVPLREALRRAERPDGSKLMTPLSGVALMVFFVLACQCMSTLAVVRRESGSWRWPLFMFGYMSALAYGCTLLVFQMGTALGWGSS